MRKKLFWQARREGECSCELREMNRHAPRRHLSNTAERDAALAVREPQFSYFHFVPYENCQFPSLGHRAAGRKATTNQLD